MIDGLGDLIKATNSEDNTLLEKDERSDIEKLLDELKVIEEIVTYENGPSADPLNGMTVSTEPTVNDIINYKGNLNAIIPAGFIMLHNDLADSLSSNTDLLKKLTNPEEEEEEETSFWDKLSGFVDGAADFAILAKTIKDAGGLGSIIETVLTGTAVGSAITTAAGVALGSGIAITSFLGAYGIANLFSYLINHWGHNEPQENPAEENEPLTVTESIEAPSLLQGYESNWQQIYDTVSLAQRTFGWSLEEVLTDWTGTVNSLRQEFPDMTFDVLAGVEDISEAYYWLVDNDKITTYAEQQKEEVDARVQEGLANVAAVVGDVVFGIDDSLEMPAMTTAEKNRSMFTPTAATVEESAPAEEVKPEVPALAPENIWSLPGITSINAGSFTYDDLVDAYALATETAEKSLEATMNNLATKLEENTTATQEQTAKAATPNANNIIVTGANMYDKNTIDQLLSID